eukprot:scaffold489119_cov15-Prasinocladus_malaysianus.AAC.1
MPYGRRYRTVALSSRYRIRTIVTSGSQLRMASSVAILPANLSFKVGVLRLSLQLTSRPRFMGIIYWYSANWRTGLSCALR